mmetsp:Transcript_21936/g.30496  ORF Transcript_21936/g.30496 Transcript_21936/m.30496 type:complete len:239 (-) Transcript_21936:149-865(-)|eukprot:CAMPEP_0196580976 /NCGR_PEP_ID=MMETSP1081-20130531/31802_1 /TAXON_ID=36882 /ORGANISM="Pyramimonas amylifera, Strain CCMP720" /LENGTH=238 /DNA_ID=CAMNT_0041901039 /DNA_START=100 /DNA_END=816 /DNA_ORIENTATION=-
MGAVCCNGGAKNEDVKGNSKVEDSKEKLRNENPEIARLKKCKEEFLLKAKKALEESNHHNNETLKRLRALKVMKEQNAAAHKKDYRQIEFMVAIKEIEYFEKVLAGMEGRLKYVWTKVKERGERTENTLAVELESIGETKREKAGRVFTKGNQMKEELNMFALESGLNKLNKLLTCYKNFQDRSLLSIEKRNKLDNISLYIEDEESDSLPDVDLADIDVDAISISSSDFDEGDPARLR